MVRGWPTCNLFRMMYLLLVSSGEEQTEIINQRRCRGGPGEIQVRMHWHVLYLNFSLLLTFSESYLHSLRAQRKIEVVIEMTFYVRQVILSYCMLNI